MKLSKLLFYGLMFLATINSCDYCKNVYGEEQLGGNFTLIQENAKKAYVLYCTSEPCCTAGFQIIPSYVEQTKFSKKWIIVKSSSPSSNLYWVINKEFNVDLKKCDLISCDSIIKTNVFGPYNYSEFVKQTQRYNIELKFDN